MVARIVRERMEGKTAYAITRDLNKDAVPTAPGCARLVAGYCPRATDAGRPVIVGVQNALKETREKFSFTGFRTQREHTEG